MHFHFVRRAGFVRRAWFLSLLMSAAVALTIGCGASATPQDEGTAAAGESAAAGAVVQPTSAGERPEQNVMRDGNSPTANSPGSGATPESSEPPDSASQELLTSTTTAAAATTERGVTNEAGQTTESKAEPTPPRQPTEAAGDPPSSEPVSPTHPPTQQPNVLAEDWEKELRTSAINRSGWKTDFSKRSVPYREIFSGGVPRDGIPPIDAPRFTTVEDADGWLEEKEPVVAVEIGGEAKAYPLQILTWHEIVNDELGGIPISATFCPLCNSAIVFDRRLDGTVYDFGVSGNLRNSDLIMWDRQTESWWQQLTGEAIVGELTGRQLDILPATIVSWRDFMTTYPDAQVLSRDTGHSRNYGSNPYVGYDAVGQSPFLFFGKEDGRLLATERVAAVTVGEEAAAYPFSLLAERGVVHDEVGGQEIAVFYKPGARSALDGYLIADSREVGATGIFLRNLDGQNLTFEASEGGFIDQETGTKWDIFGRGITGTLAGQQLEPVVHANHFWFAWAAFRPDTRVAQ